MRKAILMRAAALLALRAASGLLVGNVAFGFVFDEAQAAQRNFCTYVPFMETTSVNDAEGQKECKAWLKSAGLKTEAQARHAQERAGVQADAEMTTMRNHDTAKAEIPQYVQEAHNYLLGVLKDPESARFNPNDGAAYSFASDGSLYAVCGGVNAKSGFGGYSGEQIWILVIPTKTVWTEETGATNTMVKRDCTGGVHAAK